MRTAMKKLIIRALVIACFTFSTTTLWAAYDFVDASPQALVVLRIRAQLGELKPGHYPMLTSQGIAEVQRAFQILEQFKTFEPSTVDALIELLQQNGTIGVYKTTHELADIFAKPALRLLVLKSTELNSAQIEALIKIVKTTPSINTMLLAISALRLESSTLTYEQKQTVALHARLHLMDAYFSRLDAGSLQYNDTLTANILQFGQLSTGEQHLVASHLISKKHEVIELALSILEKQDTLSLALKIELEDAGGFKGYFREGPAIEQIRRINRLRKHGDFSLGPECLGVNLF
jgi:hypothetical protein